LSQRGILTVGGIKRTKMATKQEEAKKAAVTDGGVIPQTTAGWVISTQEIITQLDTGATQIANLTNQLNATLSQLAGLDLNGKCKGATIPTTEGGDTSFSSAAKGCNPFREDIESLGDDPSAAEVTALVLKVIAKLTGPSRFPACVSEQYTKILSIIPVEFYLLLLLKKLVENSLITVEEIETVGACKNVPGLTKKVKNLDFSIPQVQIPTLPTLPYINIPDLYDILINLILEGICFGLCTAITPLIQKLAEAVQESNQNVLESLFPVTESESQPLKKVPVGQFLNDAVLTEIKSFVNKNIPNPDDISKEQIKNYIINVQSDDSITQEQFLFLLLGKLDCGVVEKVQKIPETIKVFDLDSENKVLGFFSFVGSVINMLSFANSSKTGICDPDPCEINPDTVQGISDICSLFADPTANISANDLLNESGVSNFISDNLKELFDNIAKLNKTYNPVIGLEGTTDDPAEAAKQRDNIQSQSYIEKYSDFILNFNEILIVSYDNASQTTDFERTTIRDVVFKIRDKYYLETFPFARVYAFKELQGQQKLISSDDFTGNNGITTIGLSPKSDFKYNGYSRFSSQQIKNKLNALSEDLDIKIEETNSDMEDFLLLKAEYL
jgi:hypothetical protein